MVYKWYILPIGWVYPTYHLVREPRNSIDWTQDPEIFDHGWAVRCCAAWHSWPMRPCHLSTWCPDRWICYKWNSCLTRTKAQQKTQLFYGCVFFVEAFILPMFLPKKIWSVYLFFPKGWFCLGGSSSCCMSGTGKCGGKLNIQDLAEYHLTLVFFLFYIASISIFFVCFLVPIFFLSQALKDFSGLQNGVCISHFLVYCGFLSCCL